MESIGHPEPLFLLVPPPDVDGGIVEDVLARVHAEEVVPAGQLGLFVDGRAGAVPRGVVRVVPTGRDDGAPYDLAHGDDFGRHLEDAEADVAHVGLSWNPGHDPAVKKAQAMAMSRLAAWVHESGREVLVDLEVPAVSDDLDQVGGDEGRFRRERHPELVVRALQEVRDLGIEPDLWVVEPPATDEALRELMTAVGEAGREQVGVLLAATATDADLRAAAEVAGYRGVVLGRSVWTTPETSVAGGPPRDARIEDVVTSIGRRVRAGAPGPRS